MGRGRNRKEGEGGSSSAPNGRWRLDVNWKAMLSPHFPPLHPIPLLMTGPAVCEGDGGAKKHFPIYVARKRKVRDEGRAGAGAEIVGKSTSAPAPVDPGLAPTLLSAPPPPQRQSNL